MRESGTGQATIGDVADAAGVSRQTVSNVLNNPGRVTDSTQRRVREAITRLNYRPNASARRLRSGRPATVAIRFDSNWDEGTGALLDRFIHAVIDEAADRDMRVIAYTADDAHSEVRIIDELLKARDADWFIMTSTFPGDPRLSWLDERDIPCVLFGRPWAPDGSVSASPLLWVDVDGRAGTYDATASFIQAGMTHVGYLDWTYSSGTGTDRRAGWEGAMTALAGATEDTLTSLTQACPDDAVLAVDAVRGLLRRVPQLEALVCASDTLAVAAMKAAADERTATLRIAGFDNSRTAGLLGFTSVDQDLTHVARECLDRLAQRAAGGSDARGTIVRPRLVVRDQPYGFVAASDT